MTADELRSVIEPILAPHFRSAGRIVRLDTRPGPYASSFNLQDVDVELLDGTHVALVVKSLGDQALLPAARTIKPDFLSDPRREIEVYRQVLAPHEIGSPLMYGAAGDGSRAVLVLERVNGTPLWQVGDFAEWLNVARWLGELHATLTPPSRSLPANLPLLPYDESLYRRWPERALKNLQSRSDLRSRNAAGLLERVAADYTQVIALLAGLPCTIIHGEFHGSNVLLRHKGIGSARVCAVDWEMAGVGPGLMDLADLSSGAWDDSRRAALADAYRSALPAAISPPGPLFERGLQACRLHRAMQWIGWSSDWTPPPEHAHDWAGDALDAARRLGILASAKGDVQ